MATKARHKKTAMQLWVGDNRKAGGYSSKDLAEWTGVTTDTARGWESRGRPSEDAIRILERRFGKPAPDDDGAPADQSDLAAAIREQTDAINALVQELALSRAAQVTETAELARAIGAIAANLIRPGNHAGSDRAPAPGNPR